METSMPDLTSADLTPARLLDLAPVVPVVVIDDERHAVPLARALVAGGLPVIEVTLRTPAGLTAIAAIAREVPGAVVGAGARFLVSPGWTETLLDAMDDSGLPALPGVSSVSEMLRLLERGRRELKFFPAEASGGTAFLKSVASPVPEVRFCPTGGIRPDTAASYLALPNVGCVGGTWLTPADALAAGDWDRIQALAAEAALL